MMGYYGNYYMQRPFFGFENFAGAWLTTLLIPLMLWSLAWKGWALWRASKNDSKPWFIALLLINTMGILDILYLFVFGKEKAKASRRK